MTTEVTDTGINSNDGEAALLATAPYRITFTIRGVADLLTIVSDKGDES